jgi:hypothetical protein
MTDVLEVMDGSARDADHATFGQDHPVTVAPEGETAFQNAEEFLFFFMDMRRRSFASGNLGFETAKAPAGRFRGNADDVAPEGKGCHPCAGDGKSSLVESRHLGISV